MKCTVKIDPNAEEEVVIHAHARSALVDEIEGLVRCHSIELIGYKEDKIAVLRPSEICCFCVEGGKIYAMTVCEKWQLKQRLYTVEAMLDAGFVKINQSCIVQLKHVVRFESSIAGALTVILKNGYRDYVSRRQLKIVKERMGL